MHTSLRRLALAAGLAATLTAGPPAAATAVDGRTPEDRDKTYEVRFDKSDPEGDLVWDGTTSGPAHGTVRSYPTSMTPFVPDLYLVTFEWEISAGPHSFTAHTVGTLNVESGAVVLNGQVTDGWLEGASVHEEGQLVDGTLSRYQGVIELTIHRKKQVH